MDIRKTSPAWLVLAAIFLGRESLIWLWGKILDALSAVSGYSLNAIDIRSVPWMELVGLLFGLIGIYTLIPRRRLSADDEPLPRSETEVHSSDFKYIEEPMIGVNTRTGVPRVRCRFTQDLSELNIIIKYNARAEPMGLQYLTKILDVPQKVVKLGSIKGIVQGEIYEFDLLTKQPEKDGGYRFGSGGLASEEIAFNWGVARGEVIFQAAPGSADRLGFMFLKDIAPDAPIITFCDQMFLFQNAVKS